MKKRVIILATFVVAYFASSYAGELWVENRTNYEIQLSYRDTRSEADAWLIINARSIGIQLPDINNIENMKYWSTWSPLSRSVDLSKAQEDPKRNYTVVIDTTWFGTLYSEVKSDSTSKIPLPVKKGLPAEPTKPVPVKEEVAPKKDIATIKKYLPEIFVGVSELYHAAIATGARDEIEGRWTKEIYEEFGYSFDTILQGIGQLEEKKKIVYIRVFRWKGIAQVFDLVAAPNFRGYVVFSGSLLRGKGDRSEEIRLKRYETYKFRGSEALAQDIITILVGQYKIHLMPKDDRQMTSVLIRFLKALKEDAELQELLVGFKLLYTASHKQERPIERITEVMPKIVLYVSDGQKKAQSFLNKIYDLFGGEQGLNETPRFNKKITSLIYYAQGNADEKYSFPDYFELPDRVHYKKDITGREEEYQLKDPS